LQKLEKKQFHTILTNYTSLTREEAEVLISLEKEFPYSQVIHSLAARGTQDNQLPEKEDQLHLGAIYTTDRAVFKSIMTATPQERKPETYEVKTQEEIEIIQTEVKEMHTAVQEISENVIASETTDSNEPLLIESSPNITVGDYLLTDESLYDEIAHDLQRLKELKHIFEETVEKFDNGTLSASLDSESNHKKKIKPVDPTDELLTEIKSSKKKVKPDGPKQKEQIEIIEQFIKTQPSIKGKVATEEKALPKDDLSEKSLIYNENIISETLVEILVKQGKKEKAIEVLKKLIWKFPQKKAYFAAQIEDLKK
jgi:hypothetical protein